jgi:hypothetical protein
MQQNRMMSKIDRIDRMSTQKKISSHLARICAFVAEKYLSIHVVEQLVPLRKKLSPWSITDCSVIRQGI